MVLENRVYYFELLKILLIESFLSISHVECHSHGLLTCIIYVFSQSLLNADFLVHSRMQRGLRRNIFTIVSIAPDFYSTFWLWLASFHEIPSEERHTFLSSIAFFWWHFLLIIYFQALTKRAIYHDQLSILRHAPASFLAVKISRRFCLWKALK